MPYNYLTTHDNYGNGDYDEADGLEARLTGNLSPGNTEKETISVEPAFVYVPVIKNGFAYHRLDFEKSVKVNQRRWSQKRLRELAKAQKMPTVKVFEQFDYAAYAATLAERQQNGQHEKQPGK